MFGRKKPAPLVSPLEPPAAPEWWETPWAGVKSAYPPGFEFPFRNTALMVVGYSYEPDSAGVIHPIMQCAYRDSVGVLHEWRFDEHAIDLLVARVPVQKAAGK